MNLTVVLAVVLFGFTQLVFNIYKRILLLQNPFHVLGITDLDFGLSIFTCVFTVLYFFFLCCNIISATLLKRRMKFLLLTIPINFVGFTICKALVEGAYKWDEDSSKMLQFTSSLMIVVYGMWNICIFDLLFIFAPSHKQGTLKERLTVCEEQEGED